MKQTHGPQTYIAITIGPIYKTFNEAKKTRAVWAASYFFSWFMRSVIEQSITAGLNILLPFSSQIYKGAYGAGLYTDRAYFIKDERTTKQSIQSIINAIFLQIEQKTNKAITITFLHQYINLHIVEKEITDEEQPVNALQVLNNLLDIAELNQNAPFDIDKNPLQQYFLLNTSGVSFLAQDAFGKSEKLRHFRSIPEISTTALKRLDNSNVYQDCVNKDLRYNEVQLFDELRSAGFTLMPYHKYYAVLYADGDNIGKLLADISRLGKNLQDFSGKLFEFGMLAEKEIAEYGGNGIYVGGEDILAFLPVACVDEGGEPALNFFMKLIKRLDARFNETVVQFAVDNGLTVPSLSYGISIAYIKYPLKESMDTAHSMLETAKKRNAKNAAGIVFQKHSGQSTQCVIEKSNANSWQLINAFTEKYIKLTNAEAVGILSSVIHRFNDDLFFSLFYESAKKGRLTAFIENFFNESLHRQGGWRNEFLQDVRLTTEAIIADYCNKNDCRKIIFTVLKLVHFVNSKRE